MGETLSSESGMNRELGLGIGLSKDSETLEMVKVKSRALWLTR